MDRSLLKLITLGLLVILLLMSLAFFAMAPIFCSSVGSLLYSLCYFILNESHEVHNAQEFENRFWTIFAVLLSTAVIFAKDSPLAFGVHYPSIGFIGVLICGYGMHIWDRNNHRMTISKLVTLKKGTTVCGSKSLDRLHALGIPIEDQLRQINTLLSGLDQFYIPSTFNNLINKAAVMRNEREIISIFEDAEPKALNYLIGNSRLALLFYKIKDHRSFKQQHRTKLIELLAIERIAHLTVHSRVMVLHALMMMKLPANMKAEFCVKNIITETSQDDLSDLKTLTDAKGDYFCMTKLIYDDIKSDIVRDDILKHIKKEAKLQLTHVQYKTQWSKKRKSKFWRKVLSDVDDTLTCSAGSYPSGIDKRYGKKVVYPGVLSFYRELDLGTEGPEEWPNNTVGNLVFLSARPHVFKDVTEKINFAKFEKLLNVRGMHTMPSLLAGDVNSGLETLMKNDFEPLAQKKFDNFRKYVAIYPEFRHVFVCDNGQGDVRAAELMVEAFPEHIEAIYVNVVQKISLTHKYIPENWKDKGVRPFFFTTYPEAALDAAKRNFIRVSGLRRICIESINDFYLIQTKDWPSRKHKLDRREELNQSLWQCNQYLRSKDIETVSLLDAERLWRDGEKVKTPFGNGIIVSFDKVFDLYEILLDWRPINEQLAEHEREEKERETRTEQTSDNATTEGANALSEHPRTLDTVFELDDEDTNLSPRPRLGKLPSDDSSVKDSSQKILLTNDSILTPPLVPVKGKSHQISAKIQGRCISKYKPVKCPTFPKDDGTKNVFSFWGSRGEASKVKSKPKPLFNKGDNCSTPFGSGTVITYREASNIVVLKMTGWTATCYLSTEVVKKGEKFSSMKSFFRKITTPDAKNTQKKSTSPKESDNPFAKDNVLLTPFGEGRIKHPKKTDTKDVKESSMSKKDYQTIGISLTSWTLANNTHPTLYCTEETTLLWKTTDSEVRSKSSGGIFSAFGSFVSLGKKLITKKVPSEIVVPTFEQFYMDGAAVVTPFGDGRVETFRKNDGFYEVSLVHWKLANNSYSRIYVTKDSLTYQKAPGCQEGYAVLTSFGLTGILESVQAKTGVHIVTIPVAGMVCYLQPQEIIRPLKAVVGSDVLTQYGNGRVINYRISDRMFEILLGWGATLHAQAEAFDRDNNTEDVGGIDMGWVFRLFFSRDNSTNKDTFNESQRSRSSSINSRGRLSVK